MSPIPDVGGRAHLCGYDINLTYPQNGHFPTLNPLFPGDDGTTSFRTRVTRSKEARFKRALAADLRAGLAARSIDDARLAKRDA